MTTKRSQASKRPSSKPCSRCKTKKPITEFYQKSGYKDGLTSWCKECYREKAKLDRSTAVGKAKKKALAEAYKETYRDKVLTQKYGISLERYREMLEEQGGTCAICKRPPAKRALAVDHNHTTGEVRRLLCDSCNTKLGWLENNLETVLEYLGVQNGNF